MFHTALISFCFYTFFGNWKAWAQAESLVRTQEKPDGSTSSVQAEEAKVLDTTTEQKEDGSTAAARFLCAV